MGRLVQERLVREQSCRRDSPDETPKGKRDDLVDPVGWASEGYLQAKGDSAEKANKEPTEYQKIKGFVVAEWWPKAASK